MPIRPSTYARLHTRTPSRFRERVGGRQRQRSLPRATRKRAREGAADPIGHVLRLLVRSLKETEPSKRHLS